MDLEKAEYYQEENQFNLENDSSENYLVCPYCNKKLNKISSFFNHLENYHLKKQQLQEMVDIYYDLIYDINYTNDITKKFINKDQYASIKDILIQKFLIQGRNSIIFKKFMQEVENKTILKYKKLFSNFLDDYFKFLLSNIF